MNLTFQYLIRSLAHQMKNYADKRLDDFGITQEQSHTLVTFIDIKKRE